MIEFKDANGKTYILEYTFNSFCAMEDATKMPLKNLMTLVYNSVRLLFWAALTKHQPEITLRAAGDIIQGILDAGHDLDYVAQFCQRALDEATFMPALTEAENV